MKTTLIHMKPKRRRLARSRKPERQQSAWATLFASAWAFGVALSFSTPSNATVTAYLSNREKNTLGINGEMAKNEAFISRQDCLDNIEFTVTVSISDENTSGRELYVFAGDNCKSDDDDVDCEVKKLDAGTQSVKLPVSFILNDADCNGDDVPSVFVGLLESKTEKDDNATWASPIDFDFDGSGPTAPKSISAAGGEENLYVKWKAGDDGDDLTGWLIVYAKADATTSADDAEEEVDTDADGGDGEEDTATESDSAETQTCEGPLTEGAALTDSMSWTKVEGGSSTSGRVKKLKNGVRYQTAVVAIDEYGTPSPLSEVLCKTPKNTLNFYETYRAAGGKGGDYCFVATAAYGGLDHPVVRILRRFRDQIILKVPFGDAFVAWYYRTGPKIVDAIHSDTAYDLIRAGLLVFAGAAATVMEVVDGEP